MNINKIRSFIAKNKGNLFLFKFKGARNQTEEFVGMITGVYKSIFTIKLNDYTNRTKSYSYNDVLTNSLEIKEIVLKK